MHSRIAAFAHASIDHAEKALETAPLHRFSVAGESIAIAESTPHVINWLGGQFDAPQPEIGARIYCDTTGWHLSHPLKPADMRPVSALELDEILAKAGLFGSHDPAAGRWDLFDPARQIGVRLLPSVQAYPEWEATAPLANLLGWVMRSKGHMVMHAASLGLKGTGVLLAGPGGSGKSGTTLAGVANGLQSVGDDYCVVSAQNGVQARPFFRSMKQDSAGLARVGIAQARVSGPRNWQGKHVFDLRDIFPDSAVDVLEIKAVLLPHISHASATTFTPARQFETLQSLAPSTMLQLGGDRAATFKACAEVARQVPGYHLNLGEDPQEIAATLEDFITGGPL